MILLDTDHFSVHTFGEGHQAESLRERLRAHRADSVTVSIITVEEAMRGWLAAISARRRIQDQIPVYGRLAKLVATLAAWSVVLLDQQAAERFESLQRQRVRIGTPDLKIASIALVHDALLLTANRRDFEKVPGLRFANWLET